MSETSGQYGQPPAQFGAPGTLQAPAPPPPPKRRRGESGLHFGVIGALVVLAGAVTTTLGYATFPWFAQHNSTFTVIGRRLSGRHAMINVESQLYFSWLGWTLLGITLAIALAANFPQQRLMLLRPVGFVLAIVTVGLTFWAIKFTTSARPTYLDYLRQERVGFYCAVAGFLVMGIGSLIGAPRR